MERQQVTSKREKPKWENAFLAALRETGKVSSAATSTGVARHTVYKHKRACEEFAQAWEEALLEAASLLEDEAVRRAREGTIKYKFDRNGKPILHPVTGEPYYELDYSDTLLIFLLKGILPDKYRDRSNVQVEGGSTPVQHEFQCKPTDPEALVGFREDLDRAGLVDISDDSGEQPTGSD